MTFAASNQWPHLPNEYQRIGNRTLNSTNVDSAKLASFFPKRCTGHDRYRISRGSSLRSLLHFADLRSVQKCSSNAFALADGFHCPGYLVLHRICCGLFDRCGRFAHRFGPDDAFVDRHRCVSLLRPHRLRPVQATESEVPNGCKIP